MTAPLFLGSRVSLAVLEAAEATPCRPCQIVRYTCDYGISARSVHAVIQRLCHAGYMSHHKRGCRSLYLATATGKRLLQALKADLKPMEAQLLLRLTPEPQRFRGLCVFFPGVPRHRVIRYLSRLIDLDLAERVCFGYYRLTDLGVFTQPDARDVLAFLEDVCPAAS